MKLTPEVIIKERGSTINLQLIMQYLINVDDIQRVKRMQYKGDLLTSQAILTKGPKTLSLRDPCSARVRFQLTVVYRGKSHQGLSTAPVEEQQQQRQAVHEGQPFTMRRRRRGDGDEPVSGVRQATSSR